MKQKEVEVTKTIKTKEGFKTISKKISFPENSVYFDICREIEEMDRKEVGSSGSQSGRKSSRRK